MGTIDDIGQKVRGKLQKAKGNMQMNTSSNLGTQVKGGMSKITGEINDSLADMKLNAKRRGPRRWGRGRIL